MRGVSNYQGYTNKEATKKKVAYDVFKKGDQWFRSGDLLKMDKDGFVYFVDRIGDTFRWKGENCATGEIATIISNFSPATREPNVYGVSVPNHDGRAGMVALASSERDLTIRDIDWESFSSYICKELATYARPLFVRVCSERMEITGTFKHRKINLVNDGFNPNTVKDPIYFLKGNKYVPLNDDLYQEILRGSIRL